MISEGKTRIITELSLRIDVLHPENIPFLLANHGYDCSDKTAPCEYDQEEITKKKTTKNLSIYLNDSDRARIRTLLHRARNLNLNSSNDFGHEHKIKRKLLEKARFVVEEMFNFESRLVESLKILNNVYEQSSRSFSFLKEVFSDIPYLLLLHDHVFMSLQKIRSSIEPLAVPSLFTDDKQIQFLKIYEHFFCNFEKNYLTLRNAYMKNKGFAAICQSAVEKSKFEEQRIQDVCGMYYGVSSSLMRMKLLFSKLEEAALPDCALHWNVKKALNLLNDFLYNSEVQMIQQARAKNAQVVLAKLDCLHTQPSQLSFLIREGPTKRLPRRSISRRPLDRYLFLFSTHLIITEPANAIGHYQVKSEMRLDGMHLSEVNEDEDFCVANCFRINAKELCAEIAFSTETEKLEWWHAIHRTISEHVIMSPDQSNPSTIDQTLTDNGGEYPKLFDSNVSLSKYYTNEKPDMTGDRATEWVKDELSTMCAACYCKFTMVNRRHHCRVCGKLFCGSCSNYKAPISFLGGKLERVCFFHYYMINKDLKPPTPAIMAAIVNYADQGSTVKETGYLLWSFYRKEVWCIEPPFHTNKSNTVIRPIDVTLKDKWEKTSGQSFSASHIQGSNSNNLVFSKGSILTSQSLDLVHETSSNNINSKPFACLSRVFCVLRADTVLSIYAARADVRAVEELPIIGLRLVYLDPIQSNTIMPLAALSDTVTNTKNRLSTDHILQSAIYAKSEGGNLFHRKFRFPTLDHLPSTCGTLLSSSGNLRRKTFSNIYVDSKTEKSDLSSKQKYFENKFGDPLDYISPEVLGLLRDELGFLLLPQNTDRFAYYFEASTVKLRTQWINSIRRVFVDYCSQ